MTAYVPKCMAYQYEVSNSVGCADKTSNRLLFNRLRYVKFGPNPNPVMRPSLDQSPFRRFSRPKLNLQHDIYSLSDTHNLKHISIFNDNTRTYLKHCDYALCMK